jgi:RNA polymerase sigma factor (sigma-70 family)
MNDDATLLRRYADEGSEAAFTALVQRHLDLVYGAALRRTGGDSHRAADVAQQVFTTLARDARKLSRHPVLSAWLHTATRNAALNLMISEQRRQAREAAALAEAAIGAGHEPAGEWERLRPLLDAAIDELPEGDRAAVVLRFLERRAFAEIGAALRVSEDAARMRTERALEKLRGALARRGITSTAAALGALVSTQPLVSAPAGLASTLAAQSIAAAGSGAFAATLISFMNTKIIVVVAVTTVAGFLAGSYLGGSRSAPEPSPAAAAEISGATRMVASLQQDKQRLQATADDLAGEVARLKEANAALLAKAAERAPASTAARATKDVTLGLAKWEIQQAALNNLRQIDAARKQFRLDQNQAASSVHEIVGRTAYIKTVRTVDGEDYSALSMNPDDPLTVTTPNGITVTFDPSGQNTTKPDFPPEVLRVQELGQRLQPLINQAVSAYRAANNGANPPNERAIIPFFPTPKEGADFVEFMDARRAAGM